MSLDEATLERMVTRDSARLLTITRIAGAGTGAVRIFLYCLRGWGFRPRRRDVRLVMLEGSRATVTADSSRAR